MHEQERLLEPTQREAHARKDTPGLPRISRTGAPGSQPTERNPPYQTPTLPAAKHEREFSASAPRPQARWSTPRAGHRSRRRSPPAVRTP